MTRLTAAAGTARAWPDDLTALHADLAVAMGVQRFVVADRSDASEPFRAIMSVPEEHWLAGGQVGSMAMKAVHTRVVVCDQGVVAVPGPFGADGVVVFVDESARRDDAHEALITTCVAALSAMKDRARLVSGLLDMANRDTLTGLANRRHGYEGLQKEMLAAARTHAPLSVALLDMDHFRAYNDAFGQAAGDAALQGFAKRLRSRLRGRDLIVRYGGEEFLLVLIDTDRDGATTVLEDLRHEEAAAGSAVTFSAGVATWDERETIDELIMRADERLGCAKEAGCDQIVAAG